MNKADFDAALAAQGYAPAVLMEKPMGYAMDVHLHPFDAYALITQGEITIEVDGMSQSYGVGSTFQLPANTPHKESALLQGVSFLSGRRAV